MPRSVLILLLYICLLMGCEQIDKGHRRLPGDYILVYVQGAHGHWIITERNLRLGGSTMIPLAGDETHFLHIAVLENRYIVAKGEPTKVQYFNRLYLIDTQEHDCIDFARVSDLDAALRTRGLGTYRDVRFVDPVSLPDKLQINLQPLPPATRGPHTPVSKKEGGE